MLGLSQSELDAVTAVVGEPDNNNINNSSSQDESGLDKELVQRKKKRGMRSPELAKQGLSQEDLDALTCDGDSDSDVVASDVEAQLDDQLVAKKKSRRVTFSKVKSALTSLTSAGSRTEGLAQSSLDDLVVSEESYRSEDLEADDSALRSCKRKRLSVSDGIAGAMSQASELLGSPCKVTGGLSQQQLDEFSAASDLRESETLDPEEASSYALRTKRRLAAARRSEIEPMAEPPPGCESVKQTTPASFNLAPLVAAQDVENAVHNNKPGKDLDLGVEQTYQSASQKLVSPKRRSFPGYPLSPVKLN